MLVRRHLLSFLPWISIAWVFGFIVVAFSFSNSHFSFDVWTAVYFDSNVTLRKDELSDGESISHFSGSIAIDSMRTKISIRSMRRHERSLGPQCRGENATVFDAFDTKILRLNDASVFCESAGKFCAFQLSNGTYLGLRETIDLSSNILTAAERANAVLPRGGKTIIKKRVSRLMPLFGKWSYEWQHFVQDFVSDIGLVWDDLMADPDAMIMIAATPKRAKNRDELIRLLGLTPRILLPNGGAYGARGLVFVNKFPRLPGSEPRGLMRIRTELHRTLGCNLQQSRDKILLLTRSAQQTRNIKNLHEVEQIIQQWIGQHFPAVKLEILDPSTIPLRDSLRKMCKSAGIVLMHGGNLYHALTLPSESFVVEFIPRQGQCTTGAQFNLALRHEYFQMGADGHREEKDSVVLTDDLKEVLDDVRAYLEKKDWLKRPMFRVAAG